MAARPGGKGPTLYEVAGWIQGVVGAVFGVVGWLNRRDKPEIDRNDWRPVRVGIALGAILAALALALLTRTLLIAFGLIDGVDRWSELRNSLLVIGVIVGAPFVVWRTMIADRQTTINQQTHYTDLYTKAVEMLGADKVVKQDGVERSVPNIEVRLGAIYALQRIMNQSDDDYLPILKTLCAYVRENATFQEEPTDENGQPLAPPPEPPEGRDETPEELVERLDAIRLYANNLKAWSARLREKAMARGALSAQRPDIRGALDVVCDRREKLRQKHEGVGDLEPPTLDLGKQPEDWLADPAMLRIVVSGGRSSFAALVQIVKDAEEFRNSVREIEDKLEGLELELAEHPDDLTPNAARERIVRLEKQLDTIRKWREEHRQRLKLAENPDDLTPEAAPEGIARLATQRDTLLDWAEKGLRLDLSAAKLQGAVRSEADLRRADLSGAQLEGANLWGARMEGAILCEARMAGADVSLARMEGADLRWARMERATFNMAWLVFADLRGARMQGAALGFAKMQGADISSARMEGANLRMAQMDGVNLGWTRLQGVDVSHTHLVAAFLASADFTNARNLTYDQLSSAFGDAATKLPPELELMRPRLIADAKWAEDEISLLELDQRWAAWRTARNL